MIVLVSYDIILYAVHTGCLKILGILTQRHLGPFSPTYRRNERLSSLQVPILEGMQILQIRPKAPLKGSFHYPLNPLLEPKIHPLSPL
jgi:hypothetical protein